MLYSGRREQIPYDEPDLAGNSGAVKQFIQAQRIAEFRITREVNLAKGTDTIEAVIAFACEKGPKQRFVGEGLNEVGAFKAAVRSALPEDCPEEQIALHIANYAETLDVVARHNSCGASTRREHRHDSARHDELRAVRPSLG